MNLSDVLTLAKAGYKRKDIDELLKLQEETRPQDQHKDEVNLQESKVSEESITVEPIAAEQTTAEEKPDFEAMYNEAIKQIDDLSKRAEAAEALNRKSPVGTSAAVQDDYKQKLIELFSR